MVAPLKTSRRQKWKVLPVSRLKVSSEWKVPVLWITTIKCCQALSTFSYGEVEGVPPMAEDFVKELRQGK